jgi:hypothetical protein
MSGCGAWIVVDFVFRFQQGDRETVLRAGER